MIETGATNVLLDKYKVTKQNFKKLSSRFWELTN